jgi:Ca2+-binding RTX toxin-like protein
VITSAAAISVAENTTAVGTVTATDVDAGTTLTYSIVGGDDESKFTINTLTGALSFINAPDFEVPTDTGANNVYDVIVQVSDGTLTDTQALAVTVNDVNEFIPGISLIGTKHANVLSGNGGDDYIDGKAGNDNLYGNDGNDTLIGGAGNDAMYGGKGDDHVNGDAGNDTLYGNNGSDVLDGGAGNDAMYGGSGDDNLNGGAGNDTLVGEDGNDALVGGAGNDYISGGVGNDYMDGGAGNDAMYGGSGDDNLNGGAGNDTLVGEDGNDTLVGGAGNDYISGGVGNDYMDGGAGKDVFAFATGSGFDIITGFDAIKAGGQDYLNLAGYGINAGNFATSVAITDLGNDTLVTIGTDTITLLGVSGDGLNVITQADFTF